MKKILYRRENQREDRKKTKSLKIILGKKSCLNVVETLLKSLGFISNSVENHSKVLRRRDGE